MIYPDVDDVLAAVIDTFDRYIAPEVHDEYAASLSLTVSQLLRSMRVRVAEEGDSLWADNAELRELLRSLLPSVPAALVGAIEDACELTIAGYPSVVRLRDEAVRLRAVLVTCIDALPDRQHPGRAEIRTYLERQLRRQQPWLVDAFTGPRR